MEKFRRMTWADVCVDRHLNDLPFKVELNGFNQIVLTTRTARHSLLRGQILHWLNDLLPAGKAVPGLPLDTADNTKVPDVVWASEETLHAHRHEGDSSWSSAPEICVEVLSPTNSRDEIKAKRWLYFERGAQEVWVCGLDGEMTFHGTDGELPRSALCPEFPARIEL